MEHGQEWAIRVAADVGRRIGKIRREQGMTAQALSDRCAALGLPLDRSVIAKLERGLRQSITLPELLVVAQALDVPPLRLMLPIGESEKTEVLPGVVADTATAVEWITGESSVPLGTDGLARDAEQACVDRWVKGRTPLKLWRRHAEITRRWRRMAWEASQMRNQAVMQRERAENLQQQLAAGASSDSAAEKALVEALEIAAEQSQHYARLRDDLAAEDENNLRELRHEIRQAGFIPPPLYRSPVGGKSLLVLDDVPVDPAE